MGVRVAFCADSSIQGRLGQNAAEITGDRRQKSLQIGLSGVLQSRKESGIYAAGSDGVHVTRV